ncbi:MAG: hypothetical protein K2F87_04760 [Muribaculaceae bacterium]|nr:hypothetical protein [Muribaculaceae bacterium]
MSVASDCGFYVYAETHRILVLDATDSVAVQEAKVTGYNARRDSICTFETDVAGRATLPADAAYALVEQDEYESQLATLSQAPADTIRLRRATTIEELVVTASNARDNKTHITYIIPREDMKKYTNFYQALNDIPNLIVDRSMGLYYQGSDRVALMLNGVQTDATELEAISKDDILKVNVYQVAPVRFISQGYRSAIDIITKATLVGGNFSINLSQAFFPLIGENNLALFYNNRRSRFKIFYNNSNKHLTTLRQTDLLRYEFDGTDYFKDKKGLDSRSNADSNALTLGYQNNLPGSYLYSMTVSGDLSRNGKNLRQEVTSESTPTPYEARNGLSTSSNTLNVNNYFEKSLGNQGSAGKLIADITYKTVGSHYDSNYREFAGGAEAAPSVDVQSLYDIRYHTVMAEVMYQMAYRRWGMLSFSTYNAWQHSRYMETRHRSYETSDDWGAYAMYQGWFGKFTYVASLGISRKYISTSENGDQCLWSPTPSVNVYYSPLNNLWINLGYSYTTGAPSIAQLSQTDQWLDTRLVYHGNPALHTYRHHAWQAAVNLTSRYLNAYVMASYATTPGYICNYFMMTPEYVLETIVNLRKYRDLFGRIQLTGKPLGNNRWTISTYINLGRLRGAGETYDWKGFRFQWFTTTQVNLSKWSIYASYQFPGKVAEGQLIMPRTQSWRIGGAFRPKENLSVGVDITCPFGKGWKESERTVNTAIVDRRSTSTVPQRANLVTLTFEWNLQFGHNHNQAAPQLTHSTDETGILTK